MNRIGNFKCCHRTYAAKQEAIIADLVNALALWKALAGNSPCEVKQPQPMPDSGLPEAGGTVGSLPADSHFEKHAALLQKQSFIDSELDQAMSRASQVVEEHRGL